MSINKPLVGSGTPASTAVNIPELLLIGCTAGVVFTGDGRGAGILAEGVSSLTGLATGEGA